MPNTIYDERIPVTVVSQADSSWATNATIVLGGGTQMIRVDCIAFASKATGAHVIEILIATPTTPRLIGSVNVAAGAGSDGTASVQALSQFLAAPLDGLNFGPGQSLYFRMQVALPGGEVIGYLISGGYL